MWAIRCGVAQLDISTEKGVKSLGLVSNLGKPTDKNWNAAIHSRTHAHTHRPVYSLISGQLHLSRLVAGMLRKTGTNIKLAAFRLSVSGQI